MNRFSVCSTIREENVLDVIKNLKDQLNDETELVIVDASFSDQKNFIGQYPFPVKYAFRQGVNRSVGRNAAARLASNDNLIFIDHGCLPKKNWFYQMSQALSREKNQIIVGAYESPINSFREKLMVAFLNVGFDSNSGFIYPSARNFGISKKVFNMVGKFNEKLNYAEDTEFFKRAADRKIHFKNAFQAKVVWPLPKTNAAYLAKIWQYAMGDLKNAIWWDDRKKWQTHNLKHLLLVARFLILLVLFLVQKYLALFFLTLYLVAVAKKHRINFKKFAGNDLLVLKNVCCFVSLKLLTDLAVLIGVFSGIALIIGNALRKRFNIIK